MRILLIGRSGQLGGDLLRQQRGHEIAAPDRSELDITRPAQVREAIGRHRPELVINCAAFHNVPLCEEQPEQAFLVNCVAVWNLAASCREAGARLVAFSSDYVFGGERSVPWGRTIFRIAAGYGTSRLAGEHAALAAAPGTRSSSDLRARRRIGRRAKGGNLWTAGGGRARRRAIEMASEQIIAPTRRDRSRRCCGHEQRAAPGIDHLVNDGACSGTS